ncbi:MAG TPA: hypothetical protein VHH34_09600 [Pseudonocardiaceae bacterium]|nr:hypothetical protein [Pseudonocardiaceae bacterium]
MSDASTNQPLPADVQEIAAGHGRHRGPVSTTQDGDTAPRGRHRKSAEEQTETAA